MECPECGITKTTFQSMNAHRSIKHKVKSPKVIKECRNCGCTDKCTKSLHVPTPPPEVVKEKITACDTGYCVYELPTPPLNTKEWKEELHNIFIKNGERYWRQDIQAEIVSLFEITLLSQKNQIRGRIEELIYKYNRKTDLKVGKNQILLGVDGRLMKKIIATLK